MSTEAHKRLAAQLRQAEEIIGTLDLRQVGEAHVKIVAGQPHPDITVKLVGTRWIGEHGPELTRLPYGTRTAPDHQSNEEE